MEIITDLTKLHNVSEQLILFTDQGLDKKESEEIMSKLKETFEENPNVKALAAPQIGINKRIFGIKYADDTIKFFINPVITKKGEAAPTFDYCASMPGKEILILRPAEITAVYTNNEFQYEENKFLKGVSAVFDQMVQLLDGITPDELGLVSDTATDSPFEDLTPEERAEAFEILKKYIKVKTDAKLKEVQAQIEENPELDKQFRQLKFTEDVINGRTLVVDDTKGPNRAHRRQAKKMSKQLAKIKNMAENEVKEEKEGAVQ